MKTNSYKRILAYIIDICIVSLISTLLNYMIPVSNNYKQLNNQLTEIVEKYTNKEITMADYMKQFNDLNYEISKEIIPTSIITLVITIIYFIVVTYYLNGETLGKKILKIKIVSNNDKKLTMNSLLIRSFIINSIAINIFSIVTIFFLKKSFYLNIYNIVSYIYSIILIICFAMILFRKDGRGLHDLLANTKVISTSNKEK